MSLIFFQRHFSLSICEKNLYVYICSHTERGKCLWFLIYMFTYRERKVYICSHIERGKCLWFFFLGKHRQTRVSIRIFVCKYMSTYIERRASEMNAFLEASVHMQWPLFWMCVHFIYMYTYMERSVSNMSAFIHASTNMQRSSMYS